MNESAEEWFRKASKDMKAAGTLSEDEELWELACYHFQQAAEKFLKGFLATIGGRVPYTHDLEELAIRCSEHDRDFLTIQDDSLYLNPFYIEARYPTGGPLDISIDRLRAAEDAAQRINSLVEKKISN